MSAPASAHADTRAALLEVYQILRGAAMRARNCRPSDGAVPSRQPESALSAVAETTAADPPAETRV